MRLIADLCGILKRTTMKAITLEQFGGVENLRTVNLPVPAVGNQEVLVSVKAIGINPVDAFVRSMPAAAGFILKIDPNERPLIIGWDIAGVVTEVGKQVSELKAGDEVFGMVNFPGQGKAYAEYVAAPADQLALKPANTSFESAAAASLAALPAWQALVTYGKVQKGEKVLIHGAGGGVGHYAVQLARYLGARIIGTSSAGKRDFVISLGADEHIDYQSQTFEEEVKDADLVLDVLGGAHVGRSLNCLKNGGRLVSLLDPSGEELQDKLAEKNVKFHRLVVSSNGEDMRSIAALLANGALTSFISETFPFESMAAAHRKIESGKAKGKIVVTMD